MLQPSRLIPVSELGSSPAEIRAKKIFTDPKITKQFHDFTDNLDWLFANYEKLRERYTDTFVAVRGKNICYASKDPIKFIAHIRERYSDDQSVVTNFIRSKDVALVI